MSNKSYLSVYAKSFSWAGFFLPKVTFKKCSALYDFCRVADNIADDDEKIEIKEKKFLQFENDFNPISDMRASSKYRNLVAKNLLKKYFIELSKTEKNTNVLRVEI